MLIANKRQQSSLTKMSVVRAEFDTRMWHRAGELPVPAPLQTGILLIELFLPLSYIQADVESKTNL